MNDDYLGKDIEAINTLIQNILEKDNISFSKFVGMLKKKREEETAIMVPSSVFKERSLGILESLVVYLKDNINLTYHEIASLLNRDDRVIWGTYNNARKKFKGNFVAGKQAILIPVFIFTNRKIGVLESLVKYMKEELKFENYEIAGILNRNNRTIWTSYSRAIRKQNLLETNRSAAKKKK